MTGLLIILTVLVSGSAFADMSQFYNNHVGGTVYGRSPNISQQYSESRGNARIFNDPPSSISQYYYSRPEGMMQDKRMILDAPVGNTPMGMPQPAPQIMVPNQPFGPGLVPPPFGR